jgi:hypothetical protein
MYVGFFSSEFSDTIMPPKRKIKKPAASKKRSGGDGQMGHTVLPARYFNASAPETSAAPRIVSPHVQDPTVVRPAIKSTFPGAHHQSGAGLFTSKVAKSGKDADAKTKAAKFVVSLAKALIAAAENKRRR